MIDGFKVLAVIPARGGSKGLIRKNVLPLAGKPMLAWTIEAARHSRYLDRVVLSSEDQEIIACAREHGCEVPFIRPAALAEDTTPGADVLFHALEQLPHYQLIVWLQPTSPLRTSADIDTAIEMLVQRNAPMCVSLTRSKSPAWMYTLDQECRMQPIIHDQPHTARRQDLSATYILNGAIYVGRVEEVRRAGSFFTAETIGYVMPKERSIDVDDAIDFGFAEALLRCKKP